MASSSATSQFDNITVKLPKGTKDRIKKLTGKNYTAYITDLVLRDLDCQEKRRNSGPDLFTL